MKTTLEQYNNLKAQQKEIKQTMINIKQEVFVSFCEEIEGLKLSGMSTKKAKKEALDKLKNKYDNCGYEISLINLFSTVYDIHADKIFNNYKELNKFRLMIKRDNLTKSQVINLFK